ARMVKRATTLAVRSALVAMALIPAAYAADAVDPAVAELVKPTSTIEVGAGYVSDDSAKFGEYNGLNKQGPFAIGGFDIRGGDAYDSPGTVRYRAFGLNLGLENRTLGAEIASQGSYRFRYTYDEL